MLKGLTTEEVKKRQEQYGRNMLQSTHSVSFLRLFLSKFTDPLTILLIIAATISFVVGEPVEGALILVIVILNAGFSMYQEKRASDAVALLKNLSVTVVRVIRDGHEQELDSTYLVPGDIIYVEEGSKIVADCKFVEGKNLEANESVLTGESLPVPKKEGEEVFMGTVVARGRGHLEVLKIGMDTRFGNITRNLGEVKPTPTPLERKLRLVSKRIGIAGIIVSFIVFALTAYSGSGLGFAFLVAVSLAVAVVPEGLPAVLTITLGLGVKEMAKKKAIVRHLSAIEAIGNVTLIATDKTGTLTTGNMRVKELFVDGKVHEHGRPNVNNHPFAKMLLIGMVDSTASLVPVHGSEKLEILGDTTEGAILTMAHEVGQSYETARREWKLLDESPFDGVTKRMSVVASNDRETYLLTKGAPESIMDICTHTTDGDKSVPMGDKHKKEIEKTMELWATRGYRVIGFSYKPVSKTDKRPIDEEVEGMTFAGLVALYDPPRAEVKDALLRANQAGIRVVMVTGDNEKTAETIATEIGMMKDGDEILTGKQVDEFSDEKLMELLPKTRVFARTTPLHKSRIVSLYQKLGEIVAVTGDGVNDAIALKQADVGIAMGRDGTDVARDTAAIVLADDNFASIIDAVQEGRRIITNFKNSFIYLITGNFSEALTLIGGLMFGIHDLFFPIQLLYINLMTDGLPALTFAFAPVYKYVMRQPPEREFNLLDKRARHFILGLGSLIAGSILVTYFVFLPAIGETLAKTGVFIQMNMAQVFMFVGLWSAHRALTSLRQTFSPIFFAGLLTPIIMQLLVNALPFTTKALHIEQVPYTMFFLFFGLSTIPVALYFAATKGVSMMLALPKK